MEEVSAVGYLSRHSAEIHGRDVARFVSVEALLGAIDEVAAEHTSELSDKLGAAVADRHAMLVGYQNHLDRHWGPLLGRASLVLYETYSLLSAGLPDGSASRMRTMYEHAIVIEVLVRY